MIIICVYTAIKGLPPVYVALSSNFGPLITALLSFLFLKVSISKLDIQILIISFIGVAVLIFGTPDQLQADIAIESNEIAISNVNITVSLVAMLAVPLLGATMAIIMRQIRKMSVITISSYLLTVHVS